MLKDVFLFTATASSQGISALGGLALAVLVGRIGGPEQLGMFTVVLGLLGTLGILARRGLGSLLMRAVAWAMHKDGPGAALTLLRLAVRRVLVPSLLLGAAGSALLFSGMFGAPYPGSVFAFPFALLMVTVLSIVAGYARGSARPWLAPLFEMGGISLVTVALLMGMLAALSHPPAVGVIIVFLIAMLLLTVIAAQLARRDLPSGTKVLYPTEDQHEELHRGQITFTLIAVASFLVQSGSFLMAAPFLGEADLGLLRAAERLALLVSFSVLAINPVIAPRIVRLARDGDGPGLRRLTTGAMALSGGIAAPVLLVLLIWPERALALMGTEFIAAGDYLRIMALAQFAAALLGPLAMLLNMSGRERVSMWINLGTLALALGLISILCSAYGSLGFAIAYSAVIVIRFGLIGVGVLFGRMPAQHHGAAQK